MQVFGTNWTEFLYLTSCSPNFCFSPGIDQRIALIECGTGSLNYECTGDTGTRGKFEFYMADRLGHVVGMVRHSGSSV